MKKRNRAADYVTYLAVRLAVCLIQALPLGVAWYFGRALGWLAYAVDRRHRRVANDNLRQAFPGRWTDTERDRVVRQVYAHFGTLLIEIAHLPRRLHTSNWRRYIEMVHGRVILNHLLADRPLMMVTGHFGNWELAGYLMGVLGFRTYAIARPLDNPYLDDYLRQFRERMGQKLLAKKGDFATMRTILARGGALATLADQDAGVRGAFVDFFGRPASTHKAVALLALEHNVPLLVAAAIRAGRPLRYKVVVADVIDPQEYAHRRDAILAMTQRHAAALERLVRMAPEQYLWLHRRWKHTLPEKKKSRRAA